MPMDLGRKAGRGGDAKLFHFVAIKPTHYDDDGYPIQWFRSAIPSNTLACLHGLAEDARRRQVLGPDVEIRLHSYDETNRRVSPHRIIRQVQRAGGRVLIGLVGVQSNQFPRAVDLARIFRAAGFPVCIAMLPEMPEDMRAVQAMGVSFFAGEAEEGRLDEVLRDAWNGTLAPLYNHMNDLPALQGEPVPFLPQTHIRRYAGSMSSVDLGRGCPYQCSFCTIINVQGRKSRFRTADDLERIVRQNAAQGIHRFFITDDNLARNRDWEAMFDRLIALRDEGLGIGFTIQVDTLCHKIPNFIEKAAKAGVKRAFIGLENINPDNLIGAKKRQNKITEYRVMLQKWREHGIITYAGYILGFPGDTKQSILRDIEIIQRELPLDLLEFFFLTPLPGSEDHKVLWHKGVWMDPDLNKYDLNHRVAHHPVMSDQEWEEIYRTAWDAYYTPAHMLTIARRAAANPRGRPKRIILNIVWFLSAIRIEGVHPLESGAVRLKFRTDRRHGMPRENPFVFYPRLGGEIVRKIYGYASLYVQAMRIVKKAETAPDRETYTDVAIAPEPDEAEHLALYHATRGGEEALARQRREEQIRAESDAHARERAASA